MICYCHDPEETQSLGRWLGERLIAGSIVSLQGTLGSGKTVFTKGIAIGLGISSVITSPTFPIIQEYSGTTDLCHIDLYRVDTIEDIEHLGILEILYGSAVTVIEWSEKMKELLPETAIRVSIEIEHDGSRKFSIDGLQE